MFVLHVAANCKYAAAQEDMGELLGSRPRTHEACCAKIAVCCLLSAVAVAAAAVAIRFAVRPRNGNRDARQSNGEWAVGQAFTIHDSYGHDRHDRQARVVDRVA